MDFGHQVLYREGPGAEMGGGRRKDQPLFLEGSQAGRGLGQDSVREPVPRQRIRGVSPVWPVHVSVGRKVSD